LEVVSRARFEQLIRIKMEMEALAWFEEYIAQFEDKLEW
jgi:hypothetical protein